MHGLRADMNFNSGLMSGVVKFFLKNFIGDVENRRCRSSLGYKPLKPKELLWCFQLPRSMRWLCQ